MRGSGLSGLWNVPTATPVALRLLGLRVAWLLSELGWEKKSLTLPPGSALSLPLLPAAPAEGTVPPQPPKKPFFFFLTAEKKDVCYSELLRFLKTFPDTAKTFSENSVLALLVGSAPGRMF